MCRYWLSHLLGLTVANLHFPVFGFPYHIKKNLSGIHHLGDPSMAVGSTIPHGLLSTSNGPGSSYTV